jgi:diacylglycerol kinase
MKKLISSFVFAIKGIVVAFHEQRNLKIQAAIAMITIGLGWYFGIARWEWCVILLLIGLVISLELVNSAIENLVNLVTSEWLPLAGKIKDIAAGAVLVMATTALIVGIVIFSKYVIE